VRRHPICWIRSATITGVNAAVSRVASHRFAWARSRSFTGSHVVNMRVMFGNAPASPAPKRALMVISEAALHAQPVAAVNSDHHNTIRSSTRRGPILSPSQPPGISNSA
jgi:hypothetical protein